MIGISLRVLFEEDPKSSEPCTICKTEEPGKRYVMMMQVGGPEEAKPFDYFLCEPCYKESEWFEDKTGTNVSE